MSAREAVATFTWHTRLDNYEPPRAEAVGNAQVFPATDWAAETITVDVTDIPDAHNAVYLLDDGDSVTAWYVAGWSQSEPFVVHLQPFPLSVGTRPDTGRPVDMSTWMLGPKRAYHLKVSRRRPIISLTKGASK